MNRLNRLRWRSRRGMLELDVLLERFWDRFGGKLSNEDGEALEKLLELEDNDLLELLLGSGSESGEAADRVLRMLRADTRKQANSLKNKGGGE